MAMPNSTRRVFDRAGQPIVLAAQLAKGGEWSIHEVAGRPDRVAKIYHEAPDQVKQTKLIAMTLGRSTRLDGLGAWPSEVLLEAPNGQVVGFIMRRIIAKPLHELYGQKSRLQEFPKATWPFLLQTAANTARSVDEVHQHGHVMGNISSTSIRVRDDGTVDLIDCDSFQISHAGSTYSCDVVVPEFTPPELHGHRLDDLVREPNHDAFGLAVLIFQLLLFGHHPFEGRFRGGKGDMPLERAIKENRFAYGRHAARFEMERPLRAPELAAVSSLLAGLFERAFAAEAVAGGRPTAREWVTAIESVAGALRMCRTNQEHRFPAELSACPWCKLEKTVDDGIFGVDWTKLSSVAGKESMEDIWKRIVAIESPGDAPPLPSLSSIRMSASQTLRGRQRLRKRQDVAAVEDAKNALKRRLAAWETLAERWRREAGATDFQEVLQELIQKKREYDQLVARSKKLHRDAETRVLDRERRKHLERHFIKDADIQGLGPDRIDQLIKYDIKTAADVEDKFVSRVPFIGPVSMKDLYAWEQSVRETFRPRIDDRHERAVREEREAIKSAFAFTGQKLLKAVSGGPERLLAARQRALNARSRLWPEINGARASLIQAEARAMALDIH